MNFYHLHPFLYFDQNKLHIRYYQHCVSSTATVENFSRELMRSKEPDFRLHHLLSVSSSGYSKLSISKVSEALASRIEVCHIL